MADYSLDAGIFGPEKITLAGSTDASAAEAILTNNKFPAGDIALGNISFTADRGSVSLKPETVGGASVSFEIAVSAQSGMGVYDKSADAIDSLNFAAPPAVKITDVAGQRYLLMEWGYSASFSGSASHPVGVLGAVSFGVDAARKSVYAVLHRFDANEGSHKVIEDSIASWRLPRHVAFAGGDLNVKPGTWLLVEADGSLALKLAASLGWNINFAKDAKLLGVTHNLSAKIDAGLKASFGFSVAGKYILVVGREKADAVVRLQLSKQSTKGLDFGFNPTVGVQAADSRLPANFDDFIESVFGVHGLQVLNDLRECTGPSTDIGQKLAGLADQTALDLLKSTTGVDPAADFSKAKQVLADALNTWSSLPHKLSSMLWTFLNQQLGAGAVVDFKTFLTGLADPTTGAEALAQVLQKATFGDTWQGQFLEAIADRGLLELANDLGPVSIYAGKVLDVLNGGIIAKLQSFINQKLNLDQIRKAVSDADFNKIEQWLQNRLGTFLDKTLGLDDLKDIQKAIKTLDTKVGDYYKTGVQALTKRYSLDFAATYQSTATDTALIDVNYDLSIPAAAALFADIVTQSNFDNLLTPPEKKGVTLNQAKLTHDINRKATVDLHMPLFDFSSTHVNDAMVTLTAEEQGGRLLLYQIDARDKVTVANRATSQPSVPASLKVAPRQAQQLDSDASIADRDPSAIPTGHTNVEIDELRYLAWLYPGVAATLLEPLARGLSEDVLLELAATIPLCGYPRVSALVLTVLVKTLPEYVRKDLIFSVLDTGTHEVVNLLAHLPTELHREALEAIYRIPNESRKWFVFSGLTPTLSDDLLPHATELALGIRNPLFRAAALGDLAFRLRSKEQTQAFSQMIIALKDFFEKPGSELIWLPNAVGLKLARWAPYMSEPQVMAIVNLFRNAKLPKPWRRTALARLYARCACTSWGKETYWASPIRLIVRPTRGWRIELERIALVFDSAEGTCDSFKAKQGGSLWE